VGMMDNRYYYSGCQARIHNNTHIADSADTVSGVRHQESYTNELFVILTGRNKNVNELSHDSHVNRIETQLKLMGKLSSRMWYVRLSLK
jgi:hypothetical protein